MQTAELAIAGVAGSTERLTAAGSLLASLRASLPEASPTERRALLRALVEPGGVLRVGAVELVLVLRSVAAPIASVDRAATRERHETDLRIRVVA